MAGIIVRPRSRILSGHDWVYASEVLKTFGNPNDGDVLAVKDGRDRMLGSAIYNSKSQIVARRFSRKRQELDRDFFERRIRQAWEVRQRRGCNPNLCRVVWSESDGLPGITLDRYGRNGVLQTQAFGMDLQKQVIAEVAAEVLGLENIIERNESASRRAEGLEDSSGVLVGQAPGPVVAEIAGVRFEIDLTGGQKTGFYLDQAENYAAVAAHAAGKRVLDCFSNQGGFALTCAAQGAASVIAVESGIEAAARITSNAALNGLRVDVAREDVFEYLNRCSRRGEEFDLIILDPPTFTKAKGGISAALRGYRDLHSRGAKLLAKGGILVSFSCSFHVTSPAFEESAADGFFDAQRDMRLLQRLLQPKDHPILMHLPETEYLKGFIAEAIPGR